jgi:hypothetical protein
MIPKDALFLEDGHGDGQVLLHDPRDERLLGVLLPMVVGSVFHRSLHGDFSHLDDSTRGGCRE